MYFTNAIPNDTTNEDALMANMSEKIDGLLREGKGKDQIWRTFKDSENHAELIFLLNDRPAMKRRRTCLLLKRMFPRKELLKPPPKRQND